MKDCSRKEKKCKIIHVVAQDKIITQKEFDKKVQAVLK